MKRTGQYIDSNAKSPLYPPFKKGGRGNLIEIIMFLSTVLLYLGTQWHLWISRKLMFTHDSLHWYGMFFYLADSLSQGIFPFWNPYMNGGENFFFNLNILRLADPCTFLLIFIGKLLKIDFLSLYHYDLLLRYLIFISGCYLFFRSIARYKTSAFIAFITIAFSTIGASYLRQHGFILDIYLLPWLLLFAFQIIEKKQPAYLPGLAAVIGILLPSYAAMYIIAFSLILFTALILTKRSILPPRSMFLKNQRIILWALLLLFLLSLQLIPIYLASKNIIPTVRIEEVTSCAYSQPLDFLNIFAPYYCKWYFYIDNRSMSESFLYLGLIPLLLAGVGLLFSRHHYKPAFLITALFMASLMLGNKSFIQPLLNRFLPAFAIIRNMHFFGPFFLFCLAYFVCAGADVVFEQVYASKKKEPAKPLVVCYFVLILLITAGIGAVIVSFRNAAINLGEQFNIPKDLVLSRYAPIMGSPQTYSICNGLLFIFAGLSIFFLLIKAKKRTGGICLIILCILIDLIFFERVLFSYLVQPKPEGECILSVSPVKTSYQDFRLSKSTVDFPFSAVMFKESAAYNYTDMHGTHFYEMKDFYTLRTFPGIPEQIKNIWAGITVPKLRLIHHCIVQPAPSIMQTAAMISPQQARDIVFIEEAIPGQFNSLKTDIIRPIPESAPRGKIAVTAFGPNEISMTVYTSQDCFLYYSDGYDPSWQVFIDGRPDKIYKANIAFKAVILPQGNHLVRFLYRPRLYCFSLFTYFLGLTLAGTFWKFFPIRSGTQTDQRT